MTELLTYEPPRVEPLTMTAVSKHLTLDPRAIEDFDEPYDVVELMAQYGSPLFVVSEATLRQLFRGFLETFTAPGIETRIAYSYKTNYLPAICSILHSEGAWAEVVSGMEYNLARALGTPPAEIIFNGPYKRRDELERALGDGAVVNIDNFDELRTVATVAGPVGRPCRVGIRVNFETGPASWTKFGFSYDSGAALDALTEIARAPNLQLDLLHNHSGTFLLRHAIYGRATEVLIDVARKARELGLAPTMIDLGGGYPSGNRLKPAFDPNSDRADVHNSLFPYSEAFLSRLSAAKELFGGRPTLVMEPGRAVVDSAVKLLCTVVGTKDIPNLGKALIADAGVNLMPTAYWYDHQVASDDRTETGTQRLDTVNIYGPLCMQIDILRERALLPPLSPGDPLVFSNVGAYCQTQSMQFIQTRPATVLLGPDGLEVIRRREDWRDIFQLDEIPDRLRRDGTSF